MAMKENTPSVGFIQCATEENFGHTHITEHLQDLRKGVTLPKCALGYILVACIKVAGAIDWNLKQCSLRTGLKYWQKEVIEKESEERGRGKRGLKHVGYRPAEEMRSVTHGTEFSCGRTQQLCQGLGGKDAASVMEQLDLLCMTKY